MRRQGSADLDAFCGAHHLLVSFSRRPHGFIDEALAALGRQRRIELAVNRFFTAARVVARSDLWTVRHLHVHRCQRQRQLAAQQWLAESRRLGKTLRQRWR